MKELITRQTSIDEEAHRGYITKSGVSAQKGDTALGEKLHGKGPPKPNLIGQG